MTEPESLPLLTAGAPLTSARAAMLLMHGRGATAESILNLTVAFAEPDIALLAPQASNGT
jgi:phospholipase/carboxylesterase